MYVIQFTITDEAFELLQLAATRGYLEYRDHHYPTLDVFKLSDDYKNGNRTIESFLARNENGTLHLIDQLFVCGLLEDVEDSWHLSYQISDAGKAYLQNPLKK